MIILETYRLILSPLLKNHIASWKMVLHFNKTKIQQDKTVLRPARV